MPKAFIIHGHDLDARDQLAKFLIAVGFEILPFHRARSKDDGIDTVLGRVLYGIKTADAILVLFTPDEQASWHDPRTGDYKHETDEGEELGGWQPRPNVMFEAGIAVGVARDKTILVKLGPVRAISDLAGLMFVDLDKPLAKEQLHHTLLECVPGLAATSVQSVESLPGDFGACRRQRWEYHDEIGELESYLRDVRLYRSRKTLLLLLADYVATNPRPASWSSTEIADFVFAYADKSSSANDTANAMFWHLVLAGVFAFRDIDDGWDDNDKGLWWVDMAPHVDLTQRGRALLRKMTATAASRARSI
jgi:hypothetical protein